MRKRIDELMQKVLDGSEILAAEAREIAGVTDADLPYLFAAANTIRARNTCPARAAVERCNRSNSPRSPSRNINAAAARFAMPHHPKRKPFSN